MIGARVRAEHLQGRVPGQLRDVDNRAQIVDAVDRCFPDRRQAAVFGFYFIGPDVAVEYRTRGIGKVVVAHVREGEDAYAGVVEGIDTVHVRAERADLEAEDEGELAVRVRGLDRLRSCCDDGLVGRIGRQIEHGLQFRVGACPRGGDALAVARARIGRDGEDDRIHAARAHLCRRYARDAVFVGVAARCFGQLHVGVGVEDERAHGWRPGRVSHAHR